jgi:hypothetical protein
MEAADAVEESVAVVLAMALLSEIDWAELELDACAELRDIPSAFASALLALAVAVAAPPP